MELRRQRHLDRTFAAHQFAAVRNGNSEIGGALKIRMAEENGNADSAEFNPFRRYVPLAVWVVAILTVLAIPLKIISYGYLPPDDTLGDAAKAVSGKPWPEILVMGPAFMMDHHFGWHWLLREIYLWSNCSTETLVLLMVVTMFVVSGWSALACLKRPEVWLVALMVFCLSSNVPQRLMLGRQFALTITVLVVILLVWQRHGSSPPKWWTVVWMTSLIVVSVFLHGVWYLWALPVAAFFLARQFRWCFMLATSCVLGTIIASALTGHPVEYILQAVTLALRVEAIHPTQSTLVGEMQPAAGNFFGLLLLGVLLVARQLAKINAPPMTRDPAFWLVAMGWVLGCQTSRFWADWGAPALMVLMAGDLQLFLQSRFAVDSFKRLGLACGLALATYVVITNDVNSRWTYNLTQQYVTMDNPDLNGWLPDKGGTFYSADMAFYYQTFYKNPNAGWRYVLGFEPAFMTDEDFAVYHSFLWNGGDAKSLKPWVDKMRPEDRLVVRGSRGSPPNIPQLEWNYGVSGTWIGRLPRTNAPPPLPTVPATEARTNSASSTQ
jgi:hypothetical protein